MPADEDDVQWVMRHGADAVAFQALKLPVRWWRDAPPPQGSGARLAYVPSGQSWIAIGSPLAEEGQQAEAVQRFVSAARAARRRPVFFGVEDLQLFAGRRRLLLGLQSVLLPEEWAPTLRRSSKLREQLRRARAKGVTVRRVQAAELEAGTPLHSAVGRLRAGWLASRAMEPLEFLVAVEPFYCAPEHAYFVAERGGTAVQFLSAVPIPARRGWLMEDMLRGRAAPNGTTELVIDALMKALPGDARWLTPGLTPLAGDVPSWLRATRRLAAPLYDFRGLWRFRSRLHPARWTRVWLAWDRGSAPVVLLDVLRAFAGGHLARFAWRSIVRHPNGPPWAMAVPLLAWTALLAGLTLSGRAALLGFASASLQAWAAFDALLAWLLFDVARRPTRRALAGAALAAAADAAASVVHVAEVGLGPSATAAALRLIATVGPLLGTGALAWAWWKAGDERRARPARPDPQ